MSPQLWARGPYIVSVALLACCSSGCFGPQREWPDDLVWSPDGKHAAVLRAGFRISDSDGTLTPQLDVHVYRVAWLDSDRLLVARTRTVDTFDEVAAALGPERTKAISVQAEHAWTHFQSPGFPEFMPEIPLRILSLYLRAYYADAFRQKAGEEWTKIEHEAATLHQLVVARIVEGRLELGATLSEDVWPIKTIRPAPDRRSVAFVTLDEEFLSSDEVARIHVAPIEAASRSRQVAVGTGEYVDWSRDSRTLLYFSESGSTSSRSGCLERLAVFDTTGTVVNAKDLQPTCLSYLLFERSDQVASLPDDRVLFEGWRVELPSDLGDSPLTFTPGSPSVQPRLPSGITHQLFVLRREPDQRYPTLDRFPVTPLISQDVPQREGGVAFFELSPDRKRVMYGTGIGEIRVLTVEDGRTELLPLGLRGLYIRRDLPHAVWSGPDAFTYVKKIGTRSEFILRQGNAETVLSREWPEDMLWPYPPAALERNIPGPSPSSARNRASRR